MPGLAIQCSPDLALTFSGGFNKGSSHCPKLAVYLGMKEQIPKWAFLIDTITTLFNIVQACVAQMCSHMYTGCRTGQASVYASSNPMLSSVHACANMVKAMFCQTHVCPPKYVYSPMTVRTYPNTCPHMVTCQCMSRR